MLDDRLALNVLGLPAAPARASVVLRDVFLQRRGTPLLRGLNLDLAPAELLAVTGAEPVALRGLLRLIAGRVGPDAGSVAYVGPRPRVRLFEPGARLRPWLRLQANVERHTRPGEHALAFKLLSQLGLASLARAWPRQLPRPAYRRAQLACLFAACPHLLLLDDPGIGLATAERVALFALLARLVRWSGCSALLTAGDARDALTFAGRVLVLDHGRVGQELRPDSALPRRAGFPDFATGLTP